VIPRSILHDADPEENVPQPVQRNKDVDRGDDAIINTCMCTLAMQHHCFHGCVVIATNGAQPELLAVHKHAPICPEDEEAQKQSDACEVSEIFDP